MPGNEAIIEEAIKTLGATVCHAKCGAVHGYRLLKLRYL